MDIKMNQRIFALIAAAMVALSSSVVMAERTTTPVSDKGTVTIEQPATSTTAPATQEQTPTVETTPAVAVPTAVATTQESNVIETGQTQKQMEKKYASKGFVMLWVFLLVIINAVVSFLIANRFYKLSRRENHVASEVRALRRDLEDKFIKSVDGFAEMETDVTNSNENYSADGSIEEGAPAASSFSKESEDIFKQWESKMTRRAARTVDAPTPALEDEEIPEEAKRVKKYQPMREKMTAAKEQIQQSGIKDKAKEFIGNIFPFKD